MNPNLPIYLYAAVFVALLGGAIDLVHSAVNPMSSSLFEFILTALGALLGHVLTLINPRGQSAPPAASPGDKQAGRAMPFLLLILAIGAALLMGGCAGLNVQWAATATYNTPASTTATMTPGAATAVKAATPTAIPVPGK